MSEEERMEESYRHNLWKNHKITPEFVEKLFKKQKFGCAICHKKPGRKQLVVDHDHKTGKVRSLLCSNCNLGLGQFMDSPRLLAAAIVYLEDHGTTYQDG